MKGFVAGLIGIGCSYVALGAALSITPKPLLSMAFMPLGVPVGVSLGAVFGALSGLGWKDGGLTAGVVALGMLVFSELAVLSLELGGVERAIGGGVVGALGVAAIAITLRLCDSVSLRHELSKINFKTIGVGTLCGTLYGIEAGAIAMFGSLKKVIGFLDLLLLGMGIHAIGILVGLIAADESPTVSQQEGFRRILTGDDAENESPVISQREEDMKVLAATLIGIGFSLMVAVAEMRSEPLVRMAIITIKVIAGMKLGEQFGVRVGLRENIGGLAAGLGTLLPLVGAESVAVSELEGIKRVIGGGLVGGLGVAALAITNGLLKRLRPLGNSGSLKDELRNINFKAIGFGALYGIGFGAHCGTLYGIGEGSGGELLRRFITCLSALGIYGGGWVVGLAAANESLVVSQRAKDMKAFLIGAAFHLMLAVAEMRLDPQLRIAVMPLNVLAGIPLGVGLGGKKGELVAWFGALFGLVFSELAALSKLGGVESVIGGGVVGGLGVAATAITFGLLDRLGDTGNSVSLRHELRNMNFKAIVAGALCGIGVGALDMMLEGYVDDDSLKGLLSYAIFGCIEIVQFLNFILATDKSPVEKRQHLSLVQNSNPSINNFVQVQQRSFTSV